MAVMLNLNSRIRAYGKARLDVARRANTAQEWERLWKPPAHDFPFEWGPYWKQCIEYTVHDFAAEVGFYIDVLGFSVNAFTPEYAQFTSPDGAFHLAILPAADERMSTPPGVFRLQFMVQNLAQVIGELEGRGVVFAYGPQLLQVGGKTEVCGFHTPHGVLIELWGQRVAQPVVQDRRRAQPAVQPTAVQAAYQSKPSPQAKPIPLPAPVEDEEEDDDHPKFTYRPVTESQRPIFRLDAGAFRHT